MSNDSGDVQHLRRVPSDLQEKMDEMMALKAEKRDWEVERCRLERESQVQDDKLKDLARELGVSKEAEARANERYGKALEFTAKIEGKIDELKAGFEAEKKELNVKFTSLKESEEALKRMNKAVAGEKMKLDGLVEQLRVQLGEKEDELSKCEAEKRELIVKFTSLKEMDEGFRGRYEVVAGEKMKLDGLVEQLRVQLREKEDELKKCEAELRKREGEATEEGELKRLKVELRKREMKAMEYNEVLGEFKAIIREKNETIDELTKKNEELEKGNNNDSESTIELVKRTQMLESQFLGVISMKDAKIGELVREKENLERDNRELMAKYKGVEERFLELEADVVENLCMEVKQDKKLASSKIGLIISSILEADFVSQVHDTKCSLNPETNSEETVKTTVVSEEDMSGENGAGWNLNVSPPDCIDITDSDDDEITPDVSGCQREKERPKRLSQEHCEDSSSGESLNPKRKIQKLEQVVGEPTKQGQSIGVFASTIDHKLTTPHKQTLPAIRKCEETSNKGKEGSDYKTVSRSRMIDVQEYIAKCQEKREKKAVKTVTDLVCACENDPVFCAKAVCSLYRKGLLLPGQGGFKESDIERATAVAECLVKGDPNSGKMKSLDELKQSNSGGFDICRKLARQYRDMLFKIFESNEDPLFSAMSTDMQDRGRQ